MNRNIQILKMTLIAFFLIINSLMLLAQQKPKKNNDFRNIEQFIKLYSDSINNCFKKDSVIPVFLYNSNFDLKPLYWAGMHKPVSLRYLVIQKITNTEVLDFIIENGDTALLKGLSKTDSPLPFRKYSFFDLILYRMSELRNQKNSREFQVGIGMRK